jgi:hypothetical protein
MVNLKRAYAAIWNASGTLDGGAPAGQDGRADVVVTATAYAFDRDHAHAYGIGNVTAKRRLAGALRRRRRTEIPAPGYGALSRGRSIAHGVRARLGGRPTKHVSE